MNDLITLIEKEIGKNHQLNTGWEYVLDLQNSCIQSDHFNIISVRFRGEATMNDIIQVTILYTLHNHHKLNYRTKRFRGIENAILYVFYFPDKYFLCENCCQLVKINEQCNQCLFFKVFMDFKGKKEICGICHEPSTRTMLSCHHHFHKACLLKMDPEDIKCPLCRKPIEEDIIYSIFGDEDEKNEIMSDDEI